MQGRSLKSQLKHADKLGARYVIILGDEEVKQSKVLVKDMDSGDEKLISDNIDEIILGMKL